MTEFFARHLFSFHSVPQDLHQLNLLWNMSAVILQSYQRSQSSQRFLDLLFLFSTDGQGTKYMRLHNTVNNILTERSILNLKSAEIYRNIGTAKNIFQDLIRSENKQQHDEGYTYALLNKVKSHCKALIHCVASQFTSLEGAFRRNRFALVDALFCKNLLDKGNFQESSLPKPC